MTSELNSFFRSRSRDSVSPLSARLVLSVVFLFACYLLTHGGCTASPRTVRSSSSFDEMDSRTGASHFATGVIEEQALGMTSESSASGISPGDASSPLSADSRASSTGFEPKQGLSASIRRSLMSETRDHATVIRRLSEWLQRQGAEIDGLAVRPSSLGGHGVFTTKALAEGDVMFRIPKSLLLHSNRVCEDDFFVERDLCGFAENMNGRIPLAFFILRELDSPSSPWRVYLESFPQQIHVHGTLFEQQDIDILKNLFSYEYTLDMVNRLRALSKVMSDWVEKRQSENKIRIFPSSFYNESERLWALSLVASRCWGNHENVTMVPFVDFLNSDPRGNSLIGVLDDNVTSVFVRADRAYADGDELYIRYLHPSTGSVVDSIVIHGFLDDSLHLPLYFSAALEESDRFYVLKRDAMEKARCMERIPFLLVPDLGLSNFLQCARLFCLDEKTIQYFSYNMTSIVSLDNEFCAARLVSRAFRKVQEGHTPTLEEDISYFKSNTLSPIQTVLYRLRIWEKKMIANAVDLMDQYWLRLIR